ncbi:MAG: type II secretion system protein [Elusimicrobia bacterium]|nr:type II secretion system protein [Elusimicrobiota bacterium]
MKIKKIRGFTLIEMAVTLIVVIILMSVSVPLYKANTEDFKKAEGYALLANIRSAQEQYYAEYGYFLCANESSAHGHYHFTAKDEVLGINAITNKYFTYFCVNGSGKSGFDGTHIYSNNETNKYNFIACVTGQGGHLKLTYNVTRGTIFTEESLY